MKNASWGLSLWIVLSFAAEARAETYYVDDTGDDGADGSSGAPWATLQQAADRVAAGDVVVVRPGSYAGFYLDTSGTASAPITFARRRAPSSIVTTERRATMVARRATRARRAPPTRASSPATTPGAASTRARAPRKTAAVAAAPPAVARTRRSRRSP